MKAVLFKGKGHPLVIGDITKPVPTDKQVLIRLHFAALNHRELFIQEEQDSHFADGIVLGSDGSGVVESQGEEVDIDWEGKEVVINPSLKWGNNPAVQSDAAKILGFPDQGTFAQYIAISKDHVFEKPSNLTLAEAAAVPLSGLTAYRALFSKARLRPGERVLITGIGGGTAQWIMKFAIAFKARVFVTSGSTDKVKRAVELGATGGFNYNESDWLDKAKKTGGFDLVMDGAGGEQFSQRLDLLVSGGRVVVYGRTAGLIRDISPRMLFSRQLSIIGTNMGTRDEFLSMLDYVEKHALRPEIAETLPMEEVGESMKKLKIGDRFGKIILKIA